MASLADWLEEHFNDLVQDAVAELSENETLRSQVQESVEGFFDGLIRVARTGNPTLLDVVLLDWVEARSAPTEDEPSGLLPVITTLKRVTWQRIQELCPPPEAVELLVASDTIYNEALNYVARLETDAMLEDVNRRLKDAVAHIHHLEKRKSDFIAVAAHELRTPLTVVEGYTDMMRSGANETQVMMLEGVSGGVKRLREIIHDMIDVSLINLNVMKSKLRLQPVRLYHVIDAIEREMKDAVQQRNQQFKIVRSTIPNQTTYADPERLMQVLEKVVVNAIKYTPDGGTITITGRELQGFTDIIVEDTGIGISSADLPRVFDLFSSLGDVALHSSGKTKFKGGGPGLGLAIAKGIIEAHGGTIWAQSPGYDEKAYPGSTFHIMIPMRSSLPTDFEET
jgi:signal transduction histidine kinase